MASEIWFTRQPNSSPSGSIITVGIERSPDPTSSVRKAAPATTQA